MTACSIRQSDNISMKPETTTESADELLSSTIGPGSKAQCPPENPQLTPWFPKCDHNGDCSGGPYFEDVLRYFNMGGTFKHLEGIFGGQFIDLTDDGVEEYAWRDTYAVFVFGCKNGYFETVLEVLPFQNGPIIEFIDDLNGNGIPELFLTYYGRYAFHTLRILEWNGAEFVSLIKIPGENFTSDALVTTGWDYSIRDTNQDQLQEIVVINSSPVHLEKILNHEGHMLFDRKETITLGWDGHNYVIINKENE